MSNINALSRELRKVCPAPTGCVMRFSVVGSFISLRVHDPDGIVTVKWMANAVICASDILWNDKQVEFWQTIQGFCYHMEGVVATWRRA